MNDYVLRRLKGEIDSGPRGTASQICREIGIATATLSNLMKEGRGLGEDVRDKLAARWGMKPAQLEAIAMGQAVSGVRPEVPDPPFQTLLSQIALRPGLQSELGRQGTSWRVSTVVRAVSSHWESPDGLPRGGWAKVLEAIESGEADEMSGGAPEATAAAKKQVGRRVKLPPKAEG